MRRELILYLVAAIVIALLPVFGVYPIFVMNVLCYALFACAFNLLSGYTGLLSFGHAAFLGGGAYAAGHALAVWGFSTLSGLLFGTAVGALMGLVIGALAIRRSGIYFAMITLAMAQMVFFYFLQAPFTHGEDGLQGIPRGTLFGINLKNDIYLYYFVFAIFAFGFTVCWRTINSPFGQILSAIRDNEPRAISLGYDVNNFKLIVFVLSTALSGLAGATKALVFASASLSDAMWQLSGGVVLMALIGGMGTFTGPVVGAFVIVSLENKIGDLGRFLAAETGVKQFTALGESVTIVTGLIFIVCVLMFRRGIVGELQHFIRHRAALNTMHGNQ